MACELEIKFGTTPETLQRLKKDLEGEEKHFAMQTTYYDTPGRDLAARNITLRRRMENEISVCTLKAPAKQGRLEFELESGSVEEAIPELCKLSGIPELPALLAQGVEPVCGAKFERVAKTLLYEGTTVEVALDQGVLLGGGKQIPLCEVEFELKDGSARALGAYASVISICYGLTPEPRSKFARAAALAKGE